MTTQEPSPIPSIFLHPPPTIRPSPTPVIVHLRRDQLLPLELNPFKTTPNETLNTRFGHFPHKTLLGVQCGSLVKSSLVGNDRKRKRNGEAEDDGAGGDAPSGFIHVLAPTPELWTISLPHRTQVVYTADSSYILHRLRTRPGIHIIEAGAGSGSFTHAAVRGVYNGYPTGIGSKGKVFSYEYHAPRAEKLREEIREHGFEGLVEVTQGDVCKDGFRLQMGRDMRNNAMDGQIQLEEGVEKMGVNGDVCEEDSEESPEATAVFLDLPAPWLAVPHLTRNHQVPTAPLPIPSLDTPVPPTNTGTPSSAIAASPTTTNQTLISKITKSWGPLHPTLPVQICTFSPCIEQIHRTVSVLRKLSWTECEMVEVQHRKLEVRRQRPGGMAGADGAYSNIEEAVRKLKGVVGWRKRPIDETEENVARKGRENNNKRRRDFDEQDKNPIVTTRLEPELKTHTSYLLFATLPPPWSAADEEAARLRVEVEKSKYVVERDSIGVSWKKEKETKKGKYGHPPGTEGDGSETKGLTRKERRKLERAERYKKDKQDQEEGRQNGGIATGEGKNYVSEMMEIE
ncbi:tRNA methyltransferase complex GCD14 subunit [Terfezia boudieri ATCC MYA-4762]|uniref:tRNA (adenine(58)-N(1))-methyltransferase catalytic subunit TRM61 n=1 Tax=Terfezia boudieri ATCC MYA-4762 TaxID=1051890 RepID=A0A3N4LG82_9PEZI|nr:tRNA methyltransferase complex GCD14 subunit [Terfezia boudieri ATCC MYA-4762]